MKYAAVIENAAGTWQLVFPDVPDYVKSARVANSLLAGIEERLFEALHQHVTVTGDLPPAQHDGGVLIQVRPVDAARLALTRALHQRAAATPEAAGLALDVGAAEASEVLDARVWVDANKVFRYLEDLGVSCELTFEDSRTEAPRVKRQPVAKKRGRKPKATAK
ncbi:MULTISPECIES: hypothetical protein [Ramlibacter]|uniref:HicB family protein n=1 Tax=Ramlibacter pinisoli TaxID=2682844 RepID=A0A6N8IVE5_9BURK|nr:MULTISPECIES: hypothetical protein [Ramlibacter]MBA2964991.1 hypothetical protein [Ramlibacter sp. CGMCC 1.13660]MVQ29956.1 hypothetical protein [Ramlibacter pinisoli]